jgi:hypothetical protein
LQLADHVSIDTSRLRETGRSLAELSTLLGSASSDMHTDTVAIAQRDLIAAMEEFVSNWRVHREKLIESVDAHRKMVVGAADAYERLDLDLAAGLQRTMEAPR